MMTTGRAHTQPARATSGSPSLALRIPRPVGLGPSAPLGAPGHELLAPAGGSSDSMAGAQERGRLAVLSPRMRFAGSGVGPRDAARGVPPQAPATGHADAQQRVAGHSPSRTLKLRAGTDPAAGGGASNFESAARHAGARQRCGGRMPCHPLPPGLDPGPERHPQRLRPERYNPSRGLTLVELVIVLAISGIIAVMTPVLMWHGVKALVFLPRALAVNHVASEVTHQIMEGGFSTVTGHPTVRGLRFAARRSATQPAIWLAEGNRIGFLNSDGQHVVIMRQGLLIQRDVVSSGTCPPSAAELSDAEIIPYDTQGVTIAVLPSNLFRYFNRSATLVTAPGCASPAAIRRVQVEFTAQTGRGDFDQGDARERILTSVALRDP